MGNLFACEKCFIEVSYLQKEQNLIERPISQLKMEKEEIAATYSQFNQAKIGSQKVEKRGPPDQNNQSRFLDEILQVTNVTYPQYFEIFLTTDESWCLAMRNNGNFPLKIDEVYKQLSTTKSEDNLWLKKIVRRSAFDNKKIQLLFQQHIPLIGKYFFQVELISFLPSKKCDFTIGIVNYEFAKDQIHSRDSVYEQSYTHIERKINITQEEKDKPIQLNLRIKVQITRQQQPYIAFFLNDIQQKRYQLKGALLKDSILIVPYIQTQYEGLVFSWKSALKRSIGSYRISTIFEEPSSIISA